MDRALLFNQIRALIGILIGWLVSMIFLVWAIEAFNRHYYWRCSLFAVMIPICLSMAAVISSEGSEH